MKTTTKTRPTGEIWMILHNRKLLARLMRIQGISQRQLALAVGWKSHTFVARLVNGTIDSLSSDKALLIAYVLGVGVDDLFTTKVSSTARQIVQQRRTPALVSV